MIRFKKFLRYTGFYLVFAVCFAIMFAMLLAAVIGIPSGAMISVFGVAVLMFKADFIITELAPEIMLFGGLAGMFFTGFLGLLAVKLGYCVSRLFVRVRRRCDRLG